MSGRFLGRRLGCACRCDLLQTLENLGVAVTCGRRPHQDGAEQGYMRPCAVRLAPRLPR